MGYMALNPIPFVEVKRILNDYNIEKRQYEQSSLIINWCEISEYAYIKIDSDMIIIEDENNFTILTIPAEHIYQIDTKYEDIIWRQDQSGDWDKY